ncbi:MAG: hypothetical protein JW913_20425 [Chitinispirillaceae bacterium]|nr:hypothetical protein [Chitinispirillaceae bacterium]
MRRLVFFLFSVTFPFAADAAGCPSLDSATALLSVPVRKGKSVPLSEVCLCSLIVRQPEINAATFAALIAAFARHNPVSDTLLFFGWRQHLRRETGPVFAAIRHAWKQYHPSASTALLAYQQIGATGRIDTLCTILDQEKGLDAYLLLRWIEAKQVLDDYAPVPGLLCRVISERHQLTPLALSRFETILDELTAPRCDTLLQRFANCAFGGAKQTDTASLRSWIIDQYGRKGLFDRQLYVVSSLEKNSAGRCRSLHSMARQRFGRQQYAAAAAAARALHRCTSKRELRQDAASLLYQSYRAMGLSDSAKTWLELAGVNSEKSRIEAIELYQHLGDHQKAADLIHLLPQSLARDTLYLRQLLLCDSIPEALRFAGDHNNALSRSEHHRVLWRARTTLYGGKTDTCLALLDSIKLTAAYPFAVELMDYRYWLLRLADAPETLAKFIQIEYTLFKGDRDKAAELFCRSGLAGGHAWRIGLRIARRQIEQSEAAAAVATLRCAPAEREPEYLYGMADAQFRIGAFQAARSMLERLILEFPASIYTVQGRLLLSRVP